MRRTTPLYRIGISFCPFAGIRSLLITQLSSAFVNKLYMGADRRYESDSYLSVRVTRTGTLLVRRDTIVHTKVLATT